MASNQRFNPSHSLQQQGRPGQIQRTDHGSKSTNSSVNSREPKPGATMPGTASQHPLHHSEALSKSVGIQPIAPARILSSTNYSPVVGPPLILSSIGPPAGMSQMMSNSQQQQHTPAVFQNSKLRAGKWIPEEEKYAELLIELFEKGRIAGCENGNTLRSFLSQKLHCAPMRISKKYAGRGIGKMVYVSKMEPDQEGEKEHKKLLERVKVAEEKFYHAVFPLNDPLLGGGASFLPNNSVPLFSGVLPMFAPTRSLPFGMPQNFINNSFPTAVGFNPLSTAILQQSKTQLQQLQQQQQKHQTAPTPVAGAPKEEQPSAEVPAVQGQAVRVTDEASDLRQSFLRALRESDTKEKPTHDGQHQSGQIFEGGSNEAGNGALPKSVPGLDATSVNATSNELPDFLSGFEKVVRNGGGTTGAKQPAEPAIESEYSPTYTTRSFDDLHCLLGKGLPPTLGNNIEARTAAGAKLQPRHHPRASSASEPVVQADTNALFTAESYAMFAQESARAASEHDAYLTGLGMNIQQPKNESLDLEGVVKLVSEHVSNRNAPNGIRHNVSPIAPSSTPQNGSCIWQTKRARERFPPATTASLSSSSAYNVVSGSEPATETESNMSSYRGSTSGSDNADNNSSSEGITDNNSSEGSDSEDSRKRKQSPSTGVSEHIKKTRQAQEGRHSSVGTTEARRRGLPQANYDA